MKNLLLRVLTGIVYIAVILIALFSNLPIFFVVFGCIMMFALNEFYKNLKIKEIEVDIILANALAVSVYSLPVVDLYTTKFTTLPAVVLFAMALFAVELFRENEHPFQRIAFALCGIVYVCVPFSLLAFYKVDKVLTVGFSGSDFASLMILFLFGFTWVNDTFAYLTGMLLGKHPLCPKISPKKTIEGLLGGFVFTIVCATILSHIYMKGLEWQIVGLAVLVVIASTLGDMVESRFKRWVGVKDSGKMLPGHGGFLDRFDSVIFSIPIFFAYLQMFD
ncbi:MAG: phosphatidate cytidylyltransferase [Bacteroidales bacterium]|nr:phosphatidate cytidylyltransferase [Bacteroidales bacterium]